MCGCSLAKRRFGLDTPHFSALVLLTQGFCGDSTCECTGSWRRGSTGQGGYSLCVLGPKEGGKLFFSQLEHRVTQNPLQPDADVVQLVRGTARRQVGGGVEEGHDVTFERVHYVVNGHLVDLGEKPACVVHPHALIGGFPRDGGSREAGGGLGDESVCHSCLGALELQRRDRCAACAAVTCG